MQAENNFLGSVEPHHLELEEAVMFHVYIDLLNLLERSLLADNTLTVILWTCAPTYAHTAFVHWKLHKLYNRSNEKKRQR